MDKQDHQQVFILTFYDHLQEKKLKKWFHVCTSFYFVHTLVAVHGSSYATDDLHNIQHISIFKINCYHS